MLNPLVSIIMPAFNVENYIEKSITSVQNQNYQNWELIIVDDCSNDNTYNLITKLAEIDQRIQPIQLNINSGAAVARNTAIGAAKGRFIAFLDSDDLWKPNKLKDQINFMLTNNVALSYTNYDILDKNNNITERLCPKSVTYSKLLETNYIGCLTAMYDTNHIGKVMMPLILKRQDFALWLDILKKIPAAYCLEKNLAVYRLRENSISSNKLNAAKYTWKLYREIENLNFFSSLYYFTHYAIRGVLRRS